MNGNIAVRGVLNMDSNFSMFVTLDFDFSKVVNNMSGELPLSNAANKTLNPILIWKEREVWQYLALYEVKVNSLYKEGYRSLGCEPCTKITNNDNERAGRWIGTSKCGGECGIHTRPLKGK